MSDLKSPWSVHVDHQTSPGRFDVFSSEGHLVAVATTRERAELICAAPELLEALQLIIKDLRIRAKVRGDIDDDGTVVLDIGSGVLMKANDAISKALGQ